MAFFQNIEMYSHASAPANPETDYRKLYFKGGYPYWRTSAGKEYQILDDVTAISARPELTSGLASTDELMVSTGVIKRMDISVLMSYIEANLTSGSYGQWYMSAVDGSYAIQANGIVQFVGTGDLSLTRTPITNGHKLTFDVTVPALNITLGYHQLTNPSGDTVFDRFSPSMPNTGDLLMTSFQIYFSSSSYRVVGMERISSTSIEIFYATSSGVLTVTATNGDATQLCDKLVGTNINGIN